MELGHAAAWPEVSFDASPVKAWALALGSVALSALGAALAFGLFPDVEPWSKGWFAGWACLIFFTVCAPFWFRQAFVRGAVVTVGPEGIRDTRVSPDWIPWSAITDLSAASYKGTHFLVLRLDPAFEATMRLTGFARLNRPAYDGLLGYRGYGISPVGLSGRFEALKRAVEDGLARARGS